MKAEELRILKQKLEEEREEFIQQIAGLQKSLASTLGESISELSVCDNHPADIGEEMFERSKDIALQDNTQILLDGVEDAFRKMDDGTYGCCDVCGKQIPLDRLEVIPWARECIHCQKREDLSDHPERPLEEAVLSPPFQRSFLDDDPLDSIVFDGEDALQEVMRYGSSDSPQDVTGSHDYSDVFLNSHEEAGIVDPADAIIQHVSQRINGKI